MAIVRLTAEMLRDPLESNVTKARIEPALDCDGLSCGLWMPHHAEEIAPDIDPHLHLIVLGEDPLTTERQVPFRFSF